MRHIVVTGHGKFASGFKSNLETILGEIENISFVDFEKEDTTDILSNKYCDIMREHAESAIVFLVDITGGSPFNIAAKLQLENKSVDIFSGTNLPMILKAMECIHEKPHEFSRLIVQEAKDACARFEYVEFNETKNTEGI